MWLIYAASAAIIWGFNYTLDGKILEKNVSPFILLASQAWVAVIVFSLLAYFSNAQSITNLLTTKDHSKLWLLLGSMLVANLANYFIVLSIQAKNSTVAALIELTYPIFTVLFTFLLFKESHLNKSICIGGLLIIIGAAIIGWNQK